MAQNLPPFFGINIGKDKIKIIQVKKEGEQKEKLIGIGSVPSSVSLVSNESEDGNTELATEISRGAKVAGVDTKNCVISIPELSVYSRLLTLPKVNENEVEESIHYALKPLIPVPIESVNITFLPVDEIKNENGVLVNWYAVAAPKQLVDRDVKILEKAGLNLLAIETESLALVRMVYFCHEIPQGRDVMIIDIGAETTNMIIARNSVVVFSQSVSTGSNAMTKVIAADFGISESEAEKYKVTYGLDFQAGEGKIAKSIEPIVQIILGEISRTLTYLRERISGESVDSVYLTGGGSALKGLDIYMKEKLSLNVMTSNLLSHLDIDPKLNTKIGSSEGKEYNVALGLALKTN